MGGRSSRPTVASLMTTSPVVVMEDDAIDGVAELLAEYEITGLPVVDGDDRLVGVISQTDLVRLRGSTLRWAGWHGLMVRDLMTTPAKTIRASAPLDEAARQLLFQHIHRLVVVDGQQTPMGSSPRATSSGTSPIGATTAERCAAQSLAVAERYTPGAARCRAVVEPRSVQIEDGPMTRLGGSKTVWSVGPELHITEDGPDGPQAGAIRHSSKSYLAPRLPQ